MRSRNSWSVVLYAKPPPNVIAPLHIHPGSKKLIGRRTGSALCCLTADRRRPSFQYHWCIPVMSPPKPRAFLTYSPWSAGHGPIAHKRLSSVCTFAEPARNPIALLLKTPVSEHCSDRNSPATSMNGRRSRRNTVSASAHTPPCLAKMSSRTISLKPCVNCPSRGERMSARFSRQVPLASIVVLAKRRRIRGLLLYSFITAS
mmetsp:Transcript_25914/g.67996  ORF Transcript_25914/g.67996 Transcript_25914/m.67996 type:complete len:202 (+) Transcript_25914:5248-5853(+)